MSENSTRQRPSGSENTPVRIPLANTTLVVAIVSVIGCVCYGFPGIVLATAALVFHAKVKKVYLTDRIRYQESYNTARAGWTIAVTSLFISIAATAYTVWVLYRLWYAKPVLG